MALILFLYIIVRQPLKKSGKNSVLIMQEPLICDNSSNQAIFENVVEKLYDLLLQSKHQELDLNLWPQLWTVGSPLLFS